MTLQQPLVQRTLDRVVSSSDQTALKTSGEKIQPVEQPSGDLASQLSMIRQAHHNLLSPDDQTDGAWLEKVFSAIDDMGTKFSTSLELNSDGQKIPAFELADRIVSAHKSQTQLIRAIEQKVDNLLGKSGASSRDDASSDAILQKIDSLSASREHISDLKDDAVSKKQQMIAIFNELNPTETARIHETDDPVKIRSKIDAAISDTHQQLAATEMVDDQERTRPIEEARKNQADRDAAIMSRIEQVVAHDSSLSIAVH